MSDLTHMPDTARGGAGPDFDKTATEAGLLHDASQIGMARIVSRLNRAHEAAEKKRLKLASHLYDIPRQLRIAGEGSIAQIVYFQGADIAGYDDLEVYSDVALPAGPFGKIAALDRLADTAMKLGAILPGQPFVSREDLLNIAGIHASQYGEMGRLRDRAEQEALAILQRGEIPFFSEWQDHEIRFVTYRKVLESSTAQMAPLPHLHLLEAAIAQRFQAMQQMAMAQAAPAIAIQQAAAPARPQNGVPTAHKSTGGGKAAPPMRPSAPGMTA